jgi:hypothetical protein
MPAVKFIGGKMDGKEMEMCELPPMCRVPLQPKIVPNWSAEGQDFDPNTTPLITVEEYRLYHFSASSCFYLHSSINPAVWAGIEAMEWPTNTDPVESMDWQLDN